ncbi:SDR family oxidoreductase [uncultured Erythrobacter sp.]|uniref:SDR family NAD(P)-dependent oxidoreductase n=1 Tax=uncultured Erythrobacter sp. TaxID=263913 RepID=UPI00262BFF86|nr:SDR family NAD(P)-dependent oxidoreductase [uncultured Erythrobacter sp.]
MSEFNPKTAVITGGASGIGLGLARGLVASGLKVLIADLPGEKLDALSAEDFATQPCDVSDLTQVEALADTAFSTFGTVDLLFNNAGVNGPRGRLWEVDPTEARAHFDINHWGVWNGCRAFAPRMIEQGSPSAIYNTGSENSFFCAVPQTAAYISAKHSVLGLTESFREDLPEHVHAGTIIPGWVFTGIGSEKVMRHGMPVEDYIDIILPQIMARRRFVVSHGYNEVRIAERTDELSASYSKHALPPEEDAKYDVRLTIAKMMQG